MKIVTQKKMVLSEISIDHLEACKIYAFIFSRIKFIYKLNEIDGRWQFCLLGKSVGCLSSCSYASMREAVEAQMNSIENIPIFEFNGQAEFIKWCCKQLKI